MRAKWDGSFTQDWSALRSCISREDCLAGIPGKTDMQKLKAWADREDLVLDFEFKIHGFSSEISSVVFWNASHLAHATQQAQAAGIEELAEENQASAAINTTGERECRVCNDFDWHSVQSAAADDEKSWAAVSSGADHAVVDGLKRAEAADKKPVLEPEVVC